MYQYVLQQPASIYKPKYALWTTSGRKPSVSIIRMQLGNSKIRERDL